MSLEDLFCDIDEFVSVRFHHLDMPFEAVKKVKTCAYGAHQPDPAASASTTYSAMASAAVSPGDSIPNRFTKPATP